MSKRCQSCGAENSDSAKFCSECGTRLEQQLICPGCGAVITPQDKFCGNCGQKLIHKTETADQKNYSATENVQCKEAISNDASIYGFDLKEVKKVALKDNKAAIFFQKELNLPFEIHTLGHFFLSNACCVIDGQMTTDFKSWKKINFHTFNSNHFYSYAKMCNDHIFCMDDSTVYEFKDGKLEQLFDFNKEDVDIETFKVTYFNGKYIFLVNIKTEFRYVYKKRIIFDDKRTDDYYTGLMYYSEDLSTFYQIKNPFNDFYHLGDMICFNNELYIAAKLNTKAVDEEGSWISYKESEVMMIKKTSNLSDFEDVLIDFDDYESLNENSHWALYSISDVLYICFYGISSYIFEYESTSNKFRKIADEDSLHWALDRKFNPQNFIQLSRDSSIPVFLSTDGKSFRCIKDSSEFILNEKEEFQLYENKYLLFDPHTKRYYIGKIEVGEK